jgi:integrase/recombinase XerD
VGHSLHHKAEEYLNAYLHAAGICGSKDKPLWRNMTKERGWSEGRVSQPDVFRMIKRRCRRAELALPPIVLRAAGITAYLLNGRRDGALSGVAAHESPRRSPQ